MITWLLVGAGWYVVHWMAARRARRQEQRSEIEDIELRLLAVRDLATEYFTELPAETSAKTSGRIRLELQSILVRVKAIGSNTKRYDLQSELRLVRQAITGDPFDSSKRALVELDDKLIQDIWGAVDHLLRCLRDEFEKANKGY